MSPTEEKVDQMSWMPILPGDGLKQITTDSDL